MKIRITLPLLALGALLTLAAGCDSGVIDPIVDDEPPPVGAPPGSGLPGRLASIQQTAESALTAADVEELRRLSDSHGSDVEDLHEVAIALWMQRHDHAAAWLLAEVALGDEAHTVAVNNLGAALIRLDLYPVAVELLEPLAESAPEAGVVHGNLGVALLETGDQARARLHLDSTLALFPDHPEAHAALARIAHQQGDPAASSSHLAAQAEVAFRPDLLLMLGLSAHPGSLEGWQAALARRARALAEFGVGPSGSLSLPKPTIPDWYLDFLKGSGSYGDVSIELIEQASHYAEAAHAVGIGQIPLDGPTASRERSQQPPCEECILTPDVVWHAYQALHMEMSGRLYQLADSLHRQWNVWIDENTPQWLAMLETHRQNRDACGGSEACLQAEHERHCAAMAAFSQSNMTRGRAAFNHVWEEGIVLLHDFYDTGARLVSLFGHEDDHLAMALWHRSATIYEYAGLWQLAFHASGGLLLDTSGAPCSQEFSPFTLETDRAVPGPGHGCISPIRGSLNLVVAGFSFDCETIEISAGIGLAQGSVARHRDGSSSIFAGIGQSFSAAPGTPSIGFQSGIVVHLDADCRLSDIGFRHEVSGSLRAGLNPESQGMRTEFLLMGGPSRPTF